MVTKENDKLNTGESKAEWREKLKAMDEKELAKRCENFIWLSAYAANNPRSDYHFLCDAVYAECERRGRGDIYDAAWKRASSQ